MRSSSFFSVGRARELSKKVMRKQFIESLEDTREEDIKNFVECILNEDVQKAIGMQIEKLSKKLPNLNPRSQIVHLSCKTAQFAQTYGLITGDFDDLIAGISNLVVSSMKNNLQKYCR